ncbi:zinc carboxypeptidase [Thalassotalea euphylliae]|uniref:Zinc carboxypeptidase n=1 Tax=Thalassotalea euphylliae TaxID=1655234 RepID=A0A3E0TTI7_9GAMM|nr:M14 family metallopeptidase [Thalassotalea euphylliae]REL27292.1 zinc carboxypeptidase [Thalassotalea euphylliae]
MKKLLLTCSLILSTSALFGCGSLETTNSNVASSNEQACDFGDVKLLADFPTSRMDECRRVGTRNFEILLKPENRPINSSPWYAFRAVAEQPTTINITMKVDGDVHRYLPKLSTDLKAWSLIDYQDNGDLRSFSIDATAKPSYIAGQEIIDNQYYVDWAKKLQAMTDISHEVLGKSIQNRPIYKLESKAETNQWLVLLGRMHPPELTGALALFPFVETLLADNALANEFRRQYNILLIPNINPDGVYAGNWRHNMNGVDLNRDWNKFKQPEVQQIDAYLEQLVADGQKIVFAVDFHSTRRDIFYTMPSDYGVENPYFVEHWLGELDRQMPEFDVIQKPGNNPNAGVSKQYFADKFGVHAITYEMGDNTDRKFITRIADKAASTLMSVMLSDQNHNKR